MLYNFQQHTNTFQTLQNIYIHSRINFFNHLLFRIHYLVAPPGLDPVEAKLLGWAGANWAICRFKITMSPVDLNAIFSPQIALSWLHPLTYLEKCDLSRFNSKLIFQQLLSPVKPRLFFPSRIEMLQSLIIFCGLSFPWDFFSWDYFPVTFAVLFSLRLDVREIHFPWNLFSVRSVFCEISFSWEQYSMKFFLREISFPWDYRSDQCKYASELSLVFPWN